jgi:hypothetical protein
VSENRFSMFLLSCTCLSRGRLASSKFCDHNSRFFSPLLSKSVASCCLYSLYSACWGLQGVLVV